MTLDTTAMHGVQLARLQNEQLRQHVRIQQIEETLTMKPDDTLQGSFEECTLAKAVRCVGLYAVGIGAFLFLAYWAFLA